MKIDIDQLTEDELVALNHRIIQRLKYLDTLQAHRDMISPHLVSKVKDAKPEQKFIYYNENQTE